MLRHLIADDLEVSGLTRFPAGFSWLTYRIRAASAAQPGIELILRLAPPYGLLPPYRAEQEAVALRSLAPSGVPVPELVAHSDDPALLGAPFLITKRVAGDTPLPWTIGQATDGGTAMAGLADQFITALARLHAFDWAASPFAPNGVSVTRENAAARQVADWIDRATAASLRPHPIVVDAGYWLLDNAPASTHLAVVHGDYRLGNFLQHEGRISAILDWEFVHVGDPHEDLGWAMLPIYNNGSRKLFGQVDVAELCRRYEAASGLRVDERSLQYYTIFALFKSVAIALAGGAAYARGLLDDIRLAVLGSQATPLMRQLLKGLRAA